VGKGKAFRILSAANIGNWPLVIKRFNMRPKNTQSKAAKGGVVVDFNGIKRNGGRGQL